MVRIKNKRKTQQLFFDVLIIFLLIFSAPIAAYGADMGETDDLDVKIGQMIMVGFRGLTVAQGSAITEDISRRHIGGVILFDYDVPAKSAVRNIESPEQLKRLIVDLQRVATMPLLIAIDQEGGMVSRLNETHGFPPSVSAQYLGALDDIAITRRHARQTAATLAEMGINLNLAPVVDLSVNPDNPVIGRLQRSFSDRPHVVIRHATAMIDAFHNYGILSAIKHFPGHGSSTGDSHEGFVDVSATWTPRELIPFEALGESGRCDMVMTAHIYNKNLDPSWPATLSSPTIRGIVRNRFHFDGVIISDDMQMKAIRLCYDLKTAVTRALLADIDILVFANNSVFEEDIAGRVISIIRMLVNDGVISVDRIDRSYRRIVALKKRLAPASPTGR